MQKNMDHLNEEQKALWEQLYLKNLNLVLSAVSFILLLCILGLFYGLMGNDIGDFTDQRTPISKEKVQRHLDIFNNQRASSLVVDGIHVQTGLAYAENFNLIKTTCTSCHSAQLITQNSATREGWKEMIVWMQKTQGLWDLGKNEELILDYLETYYAPQEVGRRPGLDMAEVEWFILDL